MIPWIFKPNYFHFLRPKDFISRIEWYRKNFSTLGDFYFIEDYTAVPVKTTFKFKIKFITEITFGCVLTIIVIPLILFEEVSFRIKK